MGHRPALSTPTLGCFRDDVNVASSEFAGQTVIQKPELMLLEMFAQLGPVSVAVAAN